MNGQDNVSEIVSGAPQLAADPAYSSGDEMDEKTGLSLEDAYMDMESSSFEPGMYFQMRRIMNSVFVRTTC